MLSDLRRSIYKSKQLQFALLCLLDVHIWIRPHTRFGSPWGMFLVVRNVIALLLSPLKLWADDIRPLFWSRAFLCMNFLRGTMSCFGNNAAKIPLIIRDHFVESTSFSARCNNYKFSLFRLAREQFLPRLSLSIDRIIFSFGSLVAKTNFKSIIPRL